MKKSLSYKLIFGILGIFLIFVGTMCLLPLLLLFSYPGESVYWLNFFIPGISSVVIGSLLLLLLKGTKKVKLGKHQDSVLLVLIWLFAILICAVPFFMRDDMGFTKAIFETTSGFATIGLTVFTDFDSHLFVFWRSLTTLIGGVGLVLIITTAITDKSRLKLYVAEGHNDKVLPNLRKSAAVILGIYAGIIAIGVIAYMIAGVPFFDSLVHSISAVATGGFSSKAGGLVELGQTYGNMVAIEIISIVLMVLGATNFLTHFFVITGKFSRAIKDCEIKLFVALIAVFAPLFTLSTYFSNTSSFTFGESIRYGVFSFFSSITTTGFSNVSNVVNLGEVTLLLIVIMNIVGGGAGSTAGGVKQYRIAVAAKSFYWSVNAKTSPSRMIFPHFISRLGEDREISQRDSIECMGYIILYVFIMLVGGLFVTLFSGSSFGDGLFEFSNAISSTGLSNGITAAAGASNNFGVLWTLIIGMFAGRLEILAIYFAFLRIIRDILGKETI